jgi:Zn-dependent protease
VDFGNVDWGMIVIRFAALLFSLSVHEAAHAWMASRRGDDTARYMGRVSLNPVVHIDPVGTVLFPLMSFIMGFPLIGWAKPVPVNPMHLKDPSRDHIYISLAGPASNLIVCACALIALLFMKWFVIGAKVMIEEMAIRMQVTGSDSILAPIVVILFWLMFINLLLAIFNLLPIPPLDGHWIVAGLLPPGLSESFQRIGAYGIFILYGLMFLGIFRILMIPINWLRVLLIVA